MMSQNKQYQPRMKRFKSIFSAMNYVVLVLSVVALLLVSLPVFSAGTTEETQLKTAFIQRLYQNILGRAADDGGLKHWLGQIESGSSTQVVLGFMGSQELINRNLDNDAYVKTLYRTLFDREADSGGYSVWKRQLDDKVLRDQVLYGFLRSQEFKNLSDRFGVTDLNDADDTLFKVKTFINRFYTLVLGREPDKDGYDDWVNKLNSGTRSGADIARAFFFSNEFNLANRESGAFVDVAYQAFFGRNADPEGRAHWMNEISRGVQKAEVIESFIRSEEFGYLAQRYGIFPDFNGQNLYVKLISGFNGQILPNVKMDVYERFSDGSKKWVKKVYADDNGKVNFELPGLGSGQTYVLRARSLLDGSSKYSSDISTAGPYVFVLGNKPLNISLINGLSDQPILGASIHAYEILPDGKLKWRAEKITNYEGKALFDLDGLGLGVNYVLRTAVYNALTISSDTLLATGDYLFRAGTIPVKLVDSRDGRLLVGHRLTAYEKSEDGRLHWITAGTTDVYGLVRFDFKGINKGKNFTVRAQNVFGQDRSFFSPWIRKEGRFTFSIAPEDDYSLDLKLPRLSISTPSAGTQVADADFVLTGLASDNKAIEDVRITIGQHQGIATYNNGYWEYTVPKSVLTANKLLNINVAAYDFARNKTALDHQLQVVRDDTAPVLSVTSHNASDTVTHTGFLVSGSVSDNTILKALVATVEETAVADSSYQKKLTISQSGRWTLVVGKVQPNQTVKVTLQASDTAGNTSTQNLSLEALSVADSGIQLISRITFGATPELLDEVHDLKADLFLEQQLNPESIDDSAFEAMISGFEPDSYQEMIEYQQLYSVYSKRQLLEVMTLFWENHFNTDINKTQNVGYELRESRLFRQHALSNFRELLQDSATSPAMIVYLDGITNVKEEPNENYARELMELHTMGVDGGYTHKDIEEVARVFTGWHMRDGAFDFNFSAHDTGEKTVLGNTIIANRGMSDGEAVLDILASHPSTGVFICGKLLKLFVQDAPTQSSINACRDVFLANNGDIKQVLRHIFASTEFKDSATHNKKFKTPIEFMSSLARNLSVTRSSRDTSSALTNLGMTLFQFPDPTGWSEVGIDWINAGQLLFRIRFAGDVAYNSPSERRTYLPDPIAFFADKGYETAEGIVGYLFLIALESDYNQLEWDTAMGVLTAGNTVPFDITADDAEDKIRQLIAVVLSYPSYQLQ